MRFAQLLRKSSNSQGKAHSASVFLRHGSASFASSASLRPFGVTCITLACKMSMEKRLPVALRAVARFKSANKGRRELMVASALTFGETRRINRTETRRDC